MLDSEENQQAENPIEDTKTAVKATQKTAQVAKWGIRAIKLARSFTPVGAALLLKDIARKIPLIGGLVQKASNLAKKIAAGATAAAIYLLMLLAGKIAAIIMGSITGAAIGFAIGGPIGAVVGGAIGATFGPQIVSALSNYAGLAKSATSAVGHGATSIVSGIGNAVNAAFSSASSLLGGAVSTTFGALGGAANFLTSLGGISLPTSIVTVPLAVGVGGVGIGTIFITAFVTPAAFFTNEGDIGTTPTPGVTDYFTLTKTASPNGIANQIAGGTKQVEFTITLTAKNTRLINVTFIDEAKGGPGGSISIPTPAISCTIPIDPGTTCTQKFTIGIDSRFNDSIVTNAVKVTVTPEGKPPISDSVTTIVTVGNPPASCPRGWPTTGNVTQGPEGHFQDPVTGRWIGHRDLGFEAIDIGTTKGTTVFATVDGIVNTDSSRGPDDKRIYIQPISCPGLYVVSYLHLSAVNVVDNANVTFGQQIGQSGIAGTGPHIHYQFNETNDRSFKIEPPYIPQPITRDCLDTACGINISSAP